MKNKTYDRLKWIVMIVLPAFGSFYFGLGDALGLPATTQVVGTITLTTTFLGTILGFSNKKYNQSEASSDGSFQIVQDPGGMRTVSLALNGDPEEILTAKKKLVFKIETNQVE
jgi:hypothetical protein